jgi:hypothetical protein
MIHRHHLCAQECQKIIGHLQKLRKHPYPLLKSVEFDINEKIYLVEIRALGIIDKVITGPSWRLFEKKGSILSLNPYLSILMEKLQKWGSDASSIFEGDQLFC